MFFLYIFIGPPHKFLQVKGYLIAQPFLLCYSVCYCVGRFPLIKKMFSIFEPIETREKVLWGTLPLHKSRAKEKWY